jgi:hypothetical protein
MIRCSRNVSIAAFTQDAIVSTSLRHGITTDNSTDALLVGV